MGSVGLRGLGEGAWVGMQVLGARLLVFTYPSQQAPPPYPLPSSRLVRQQHAAASGRRRPARSTQEAHAIRAGLLQMAEDLQARLSRMRSGET